LWPRSLYAKGVEIWLILASCPPWVWRAQELRPSLPKARKAGEDRRSNALDGEEVQRWNANLGGLAEEKPGTPLVSGTHIGISERMSGMSSRRAWNQCSSGTGKFKSY
jgi:hypothetical protein